MGQVTIKTLAKELDLSVCTINKALNGKPRVSLETRRRVQETALRLGYRPNRLAQALARSTITIGVIYPDAWPSHYGLLIDGVRQEVTQLQDHHIQSEIRTVPGFMNGEGFSRVVEELVEKKVTGLIVCLGMYEPQYCEKVWELLGGQRIPVVLLGDDVSRAPRLTCVWHDGYRCGKIAAELLGWLVRDRPVGLLVGSRKNLDHQNKITGFQDEAKQSSLTLLGVYETHDVPEEAYPTARRIFTEHPEIAGLYIGTENAAGICHYLLDQGLAGKLKVVATGNSPDVLQMIEKGVVQCSLFQNEQQQGRLAVQTFCRYLEMAEVPPREILVPPTIILRNTMDFWTSARSFLGRFPHRLGMVDCQIE